MFTRYSPWLSKPTSSFRCAAVIAAFRLTVSVKASNHPAPLIVPASCLCLFFFTLSVSFFSVFLSTLTVPLPPPHRHTSLSATFYILSILPAPTLFPISYVLLSSSEIDILFLSFAIRTTSFSFLSHHLPLSLSVWQSEAPESSPQSPLRIRKRRKKLPSAEVAAAAFWAMQGAITHGKDDGDADAEDAEDKEEDEAPAAEELVATTDDPETEVAAEGHMTADIESTGHDSATKAGNASAASGAPQLSREATKYIPFIHLHRQPPGPHAGRRVASMHYLAILLGFGPDGSEAQPQPA